MRFRLNLSSGAKDRLGDLAVVFVLAVSLIASYSCGPETARSEPTDEGATETTPRYTFETIKMPEGAPETVVTDPPVVAPETPVTYEVAETAFREGHFREATRLFGAYTEDKPDNPWGHYMLGLSARRNGESGTAVRAFERAIELDPTHVKSHLNLTRILLDDGQVERAAEHVDLGLELDPESGDAYRLLGLVRAETGELEGAIKAYERALVLNEWDVWSMNNLGLVLLRQGQYERAVLPLARAVELRDDVAVFQNNLGMTLEHLGYFVEATDAYRTALWLDPSHTRASANFARIDGRENATQLTPVDLAALAQDFATAVVNWRTTSEEEVSDREGTEFTGPIVPVVDTVRTGY